MWVRFRCQGSMPAVSRAGGQKTVAFAATVQEGLGFVSMTAL